MSHFRWLCRYDFSNVYLVSCLLLRILKAGHIKQYYILEQRKPLLHFPADSFVVIFPHQTCNTVQILFYIPPLPPLAHFPGSVSLRLRDQVFALLVFCSTKNLQVRHKAPVSSTTERWARYLIVVYPRHIFNPNPVLSQYLHVQAFICMPIFWPKIWIC